MIVISGGTSGLGLATAMGLAASQSADPSQVTDKAGQEEIVILSRAGSRAEAALAQLRAAHPHARFSHEPCDLADLASVRACADALLARAQPVSVVVNNAGIAFTDFALSRDGIELVFQVRDHLAHDFCS